MRYNERQSTWDLSLSSISIPSVVENLGTLRPCGDEPVIDVKGLLGQVFTVSLDTSLAAFLGLVRWCSPSRLDIKFRVRTGPGSSDDMRS
jgi:hypothetical protein